MARILTITLNPALDLTVRLRQLELGAVNRSEAVLTQAAGKGLNVAQVLADLGHRLTVSGFLGEDNQPPFTAMFQRRGFADAFVRVPGETRSNIKLAERGGRVSDLNGPGPEADERAQAALLERLDRLRRGARAGGGRRQPAARGRAGMAGRTAAALAAPRPEGRLRQQWRGPARRCEGCAVDDQAERRGTGRSLLGADG